MKIWERLQKKQPFPNRYFRKFVYADNCLYNDIFTFVYTLITEK